MVAILDAAMDGPVTPLVFTTAAVDEVRLGAGEDHGADDRLLRACTCSGSRSPRTRACARPPGCTASATSSATTPGWRPWSSPSSTTTARASASLEKADVILIAPSRCGKTPTSMYLALQHGLFVANYPLVDEDLERRTCPDRCASTATAASGSPPPSSGSAGSATSGGRGRSTPRSTSAAASCAGPSQMYAAHRIPVVDSSAKSVEEISTMILQTLKKPRMKERAR